MLNKIILGTANFTQQYGVLSSQKIRTQEIEKILEAAFHSKVSTLDTAFGYGDIFQSSLKERLKSFTINTKFSLLDSPQKVYDSLKAVSTYHIDVLMVHDPQHLHGVNCEEVLELFDRLKKEKIIRRIGVSVYDKEEVENFSSQLCKPDVIQLPLNPLNQTFNDKNFIRYVQDNNIEIHARSLFLQGLLLASTLPEKFSPLKGKVERLMKELDTYPSRLSGLFTWADQQKFVSKWILGVSSASDLDDIIEESDCMLDSPVINFESSYHSLLDPRTW